MTKFISISLLAIILLSSGFSATCANAQTQADIEAVRTANAAFYTALSSRDAQAMKSVWANKSYVVNIGPASKAIAVGYDDAVSKYWPETFKRFAAISVSMQVKQIRAVGKVAWIIGTERAELKLENNGKLLKLDIFVTNVFERIGDRWLMVSHHAGQIPK